MGRGSPNTQMLPKNVRVQSTIPREKNQNSSVAQKECFWVAAAKQVKNVWVSTQTIGRRKIATTLLSQRVGIVAGAEAVRADPSNSRCGAFRFFGWVRGRAATGCGTDCSVWFLEEN